MDDTTISTTTAADTQQRTNTTRLVSVDATTNRTNDDDIESGERQQESKKKGSKMKGYGTIQENDTVTTITTTKGSNNTRNQASTILSKQILIDPETVRPDRPRYNVCLYLFHLLEGIAMTAALALLITQIIPFVILVDRTPNQLSQQSQPSSPTSTVTMNVLTIALRIYVALFCSLFIMTELGTSFVHKTLPLLQHYSSRGFLYSFLGLICAEEAYSERIKETLSLSSNGSTNAIQHIGWASIFMEVSSWFMLGIGIVYMLLGLCCCKRVRDHYKQKEVDAWKQYKLDVQTWNRQFGRG